jgi:hypothetical protein
MAVIYELLMSTAVRRVSVLQRLEGSRSFLNHACIGGVEYLLGKQKVSNDAKLPSGSVWVIVQLNLKLPNAPILSRRLSANSRCLA